MSPGGVGRRGWEPRGPGGAEGAGGGWGGLLTRVLENPGNPTGWSVRLFRLFGVTVRLHLLTAIFIAFMLVWSIPYGHAGLPYMSLAMAGLLVAVLPHEYGHCFVCRALGGSADRIVLLPIGGLAVTHPPETWRGHLVSAAAGPLVNLAVLPLTTIGLVMAGLGAEVVFNPFEPVVTAGAASFAASSNAAHFGKLALWWLHYANIVVFGLNTLVPAFPLDGGRILHAILWRKLGYTAAMEVASTVGLAASVALGVFGLVSEQSLLVCVAALTAWSSWVERRRARGEDDLAPPSGLGASLEGPDPAMDAPEPPAARRAKEQEAIHQAELDRILGKIAATGMGSLTRAERKALQRETDRQRRGSQGGAASSDQ